MSIRPISSLRPRSLQNLYRCEFMTKFESSPYNVDAAFQALVASSIQMLLVQSSPVFAPHGKQIADAAIEHRLPSMFITRSYVDRGGLMAYGADRVAATRLAGTYVGKILKGAQPGRSAGRAADEIRADREPQDRKGARSRSATDAPGPRRRGDRVRRREFITLLGGAAVAGRLRRARSSRRCRWLDSSTAVRPAGMRQGWRHSDKA